MFNHEPDSYDCIFCAFLAGKETEYNTKDDIIDRNELATAFMGPISWQKNFGNVLVVPNKHYENLYSIPDGDLIEVFKLVKRVSTTVRSTYDCEGITIIQRNEPKAGQHVWHLHIHVVPRYPDDEFQEDNQTYFVDIDARAPFAEKLRNYLRSSK